MFYEFNVPHHNLHFIIDTHSTLNLFVHYANGIAVLTGQTSAYLNRQYSTIFYALAA